MNVTGYSQKIMQTYIPAVVFTLYDGYYIYSKYDPNIDKSKRAEQFEKMIEPKLKFYFDELKKYSESTNA